MELVFPAELWLVKPNNGGKEIAVSSMLGVLHPQASTSWVESGLPTSLLSETTSSDAALLSGAVFLYWLYSEQALTGITDLNFNVSCAGTLPGYSPRCDSNSRVFQNMVEGL